MKVFAYICAVVLAAAPSCGAVLRDSIQHETEHAAVLGPPKYASVGCYKDSTGNSIFSENRITQSNMTPELCYEKCQNFAFFGVKGTSCGCRNKFTDTDGKQFGKSTTCKACTANGWSSYECGGSGLNSVYSVTASTTATKTATAAQRRRGFLF
eukprot:GDKI01013430.1.p1 GENE.GDKI01013430.1~~GDKI01013430.1.p1  ORF type:complete len:154 (-),score=45.78 GDKI01013430.1:78-539(-)